MADNKPTLHHLEDSQSHLILWLLEEMGIEYNLVLHNRVNKRSPPALHALHPLGKSPTLVTPSGRLITERSAITLWLINTYDDAGAPFRLPPPSPPASSPYDDDAVREEQLVSLGGATLNPLLLLKLVFGQLVAQTPFFARPLVRALRYFLDRAFLDGELATVFGFLDAQLEEDKKDGDEDGGKTTIARAFFMGTEGPTRADFALMWYVDWAFQSQWVDFEKYPRVKEWHARCASRPAWKRALEKGNGYDVRG
ncbi:hypothetical protein F5Y00DRAFT_225920 [Daldinia vernicosa]|uniref:uncharacterized protein n=1 Tax=Daldinia vernicosa TaxID=114800 RepID=UPI002007C0D1|nr:uncharacterized protein F5Y00DRAFT_225920 [Daldinia vernicosa]KAI0853288.1 hypothetical protein F5Y00DRAFT_225920 [Daldinia vernicosa]